MHKRIPQLDGLRAAAIGLVLLSHVGHCTGLNLPFRWFGWQILGDLGVRVFFVISGFLITGLLLDEERKHGRVSLLRFYGRRTFRILIPYYVFLGVLVTTRAGGLVQFGQGDLFHALTYTTNYQLHPAWVSGHSWSLAVEEQFYLLWPLAVAMLGRLRAPWIAAAALIAAPVARVLVYRFVPSMHPLIGASFETVADALAGGCLLACVRDRLWQRGWYRALLRSRVMALLPLAVVALAMLDLYPSISYTFGYTLKTLGIALVIDWALRVPETRIARVLSLRPVVYVGTISYSLYLWQQPFLDPHTGPASLTPLKALAALTVGVLAHYAIEKPALLQREKIARLILQRFPSLRRERRAPAVVHSMPQASQPPQRAVA